MHRSILVLLFGLIATACGGFSAGQGVDELLVDASTAESFDVPQILASEREDVPSALRDIGSFDVALVDRNQVLSGGPPPDGIPSIDEPRFLNVGDVGFLDDREPVIVLEVADQARIYPIQILIWHEIVNDTIDDVPVSITYCPLCNSAIAYDARVGDRVLEFGTSGRLFASAMVMYDRQTESLWTHIDGRAVVGELVGTELELLPVSTVAWADARKDHADALVLSRDTGHDRQYGVNPYEGYTSRSAPLSFFRGAIDDRASAMARVVGLRVNEESLAVPVDDLAVDGVAEVIVDGEPIVVWHKAGAASSLDSLVIENGDDIGAVGAFVPVAADGTALSFTRTLDGTFVDDQTGTSWSVLGRAVSGPLEGSQLERVEHLDTFWFAWATYQPDTLLVVMP